ncbi:non-homologous end-joining DNA ligase [Saccharomonospora saliphila]|uniref:non-homologous end-joining DNA ligase n=1 Tax=Saccharomonospora saliphila TaxID=369829 RepID=UPI00048D84D0|nr:non-homologous end-joining DNA ligase [Saccharomonospora saliphila]
MAARLDEYRSKRRPGRTPEPLPDRAESSGAPPGHERHDSPGGAFVVHEHHARSLHWDVRLERDGVLVSFAVPKGLPEEPGTVRLAVHTEDHPMEYADFSGRIPEGEYGAGEMTIWDRGRYETRKWSDDEISVVLHGERARGRYVFFRGGSRWQVIRSDPPSDPGAAPMPEVVRPMLAVAGTLPAPEEERAWAFEFKWDGVRALARVEGGRVRLFSRRGDDITATYPELAGLGAELGTTRVWLDGEIVALRDGRPSFSALGGRVHASPRRATQLAARQPVTYLVFDLLYLDGHSCLDLPYEQRRRLLDKLGLDGPHWRVPPHYTGDGAAVVAAAAEQELEGVLAKRLDSVYRPGERGTAWVKITDLRTAEVVVGGWQPGTGRRAGTFGSLLLGIPDEDGLRYVGRVGTGFTDDALRSLRTKLNRIERRTSPFAGAVPRDRAHAPHWVSPKLVGEVAFKAWTNDGRLRAPTWRGLRTDRDPGEPAS